MWCLVLAVVVGLVVGRSRGGRLEHLGARPITAWWLLPVGAVLQVAPEVVDVPGPLAWVVASYLALAAFAAANLRLVGMGVVLVGLTLNLTVILLNGAMPVRGDALVAAGIVDRAEVDAGVDLGAKRRLERPDDRLPVLGDIVPVPVVAEVLSFGDLVLAVGLADVVANLLRAPRQPRRRRPGERHRPAPGRVHRPGAAPTGRGAAAPVVGPHVVVVPSTPPAGEPAPAAAPAPAPAGRPAPDGRDDRTPVRAGR